jgi:hypothetical protein
MQVVLLLTSHSVSRRRIRPYLACRTHRRLASSLLAQRLPLRLQIRLDYAAS